MDKRSLSDEGDTALPSVIEKRLVGAPFSRLMRDAFCQLSKQEQCLAVSEIDAEYLNTLDAFRAAARRVLQSLTDDTRPASFNDAVKVFLPHEEAIKPLERELNERVARPPQNPCLSFYTTLQYLIISRRLWRRYLRSRFGLSLNSAVKPPSAPYERALFEGALHCSVSVETQFNYYLHTIFLVATRWQGDFPPRLPEFLSEVLCVMGRAVVRDFRLAMLQQRLNLSRERGDSGEVELANLTAWANANLNFSPEVNPRLAKAVQTEGMRNVLDSIPGAVVEALSEQNVGDPYSYGTGNTSLFSRVAGKPEDKNKGLPFADPAETFALCEEARWADRVVERLEFEQYLASLNPREKIFIKNTGLTQEQMERVRLAKLAPGEMDVTELRLQGCTEQEIATRLSRAIGTIRTGSTGETEARQARHLVRFGLTQTTQKISSAL